MFLPLLLLLNLRLNFNGTSMRYSVVILLAFFAFANQLSAQSLPTDSAQVAKQTVLHSPLFKWSIEVPPGYDEVEPAVWDMQKGVIYDALDDSAQWIEQARTVVAFKANDYHYFEANWKNYSEERQGNFGEHCQAVNEEMYRTFAAQLPDAKIDTASSTQLVGTTEFYRFTIRIELANGITLNSQLYSHLFGDKEFSANLFFVNEDYGRLLTEAWLFSKFDK